MNEFTCPYSRQLYSHIKSIKHGLKMLQQDFAVKGHQNQISKINVIFSRNKYITFVCKHHKCPWTLAYIKSKIENQAGREIFNLIKFENKHFHEDFSQMLDEKKDPNYLKLEQLQQRKKHEQIMHDQRAFGYLNRLIGLSYQQVGQYYAYLDDSICTTYLIGRISYELRKMMADPKKYTFFQWLQANKHMIHFISDFTDVESEQKLIQTPYFFFVTNKQWKKLYKERGKILGVRTFQDRIIQRIEGQQYSCCVFFGLLPNLQMIIFAFSFYKTQKRQLTSQQAKVIGRRLKNQIDRFPKKQYQKIDVGLYKTLRVFFSNMGYHCQSLITDCHPEVINSTQLFMNRTIRNQPNAKDLLPCHLVDPTVYIQKNIPNSIRNLAMDLIIDPLRYAHAKQAWQKCDYSISEQQIDCLQKFEQFCEEWPIFGYKNSSLVADWFQIYKSTNPEDPSIFNIKYLINKLEWKLYKRSIAGLLETVLFLGNKSYRIYKTSTYKLYHSDFLKIQNSSYTSQAFPHHVQTKISEDPEFIAWAKGVRNILFRQGFALVMEQYSKSGQTDIIKQEFQNQLEQESLYPSMVEFIQYDGQKSIRFICEMLEDYGEDGQTLETVKYDCSCMFPTMKGLPCKHIMKICRFYNLKIQDYISQYWKLAHTYEQVFLLRAIQTGTQPKKRGKPKSTHTNKLK